MIRTAFFFIGFWLFQILILPLLIAAEILRIIGRPNGAWRISNYVSLWWSKWNLLIAGAHVAVTGTCHVPDDQPALFVSNHLGAFDIPIVLAHCGRPLAFISKMELARVPLVGRWMVHMGCIFLDRADPRQARVVVERAVETLRTGKSLVIFPEGTRSDGPAVRRFKTGAARMALRAEVPVVPVSLKDTYLLKPKGQQIITPAKVEMKICPEISVDTVKDSSAQELTRLIRIAILDPLPPEYDAEETQHASDSDSRNTA
jgi:1-acyl-sn-glycerol-3-phosphate acyltransferase